VAAGLAWLGVAAIVAGWADADDWAFTHELAVGSAVFGLSLLVAAFSARRLHLLIDRLRPSAPWLVVLAILFAVWEIVTAKLNLLPRPFFAPPQAFLEVYLDDWRKLGESVLRSLLLLAPGYLIGAAVGFASGVALGWSRVIGYWGHPVLRLIGPLPAIAWLPIAFFAFPSSWSASIFLIALASGIPVAILTWSGVSSVDSAFYDIARTLGANERFLVLKVAIPAAMPHVFVGLFMGLASSFSILVVAEMMGVKAGLGWYLQWAQGWGAYANMYAALLVMAVMCSGLVTLLFKVRDRLLAWQKGLLRW
jgi:NitT/TauT family transport system permease protein